ncbi:uncharacterized protein PV07_07612 [Cladophialophora immunda]|uniref:Isochorismatase-like domain-containing protein n=1 Tax=Cladophialophora immunda TaxID=569365 RepID=A0A0D1ZIX0_9EURO|nr:uncharacterized protein PV07_07612 [Cladophialophora immunda]KIW27916.1 hypothetical protein PV07_07612 [Cladophialophora immunda]
MAIETTTSAAERKHLSPASGTRTALLLIDIQRGLNTHNGYFGTERSTPDFEENITSLLAACRGYNAGTTKPQEPNNAPSPGQNASTDGAEGNNPLKPPYAIDIVHVYHKSTNPLSPLHVSGTAQKDGILFMPCAEPAAVSSGDNSDNGSSTSPTTVERVLAKSTNTAFGNPELASILERGRIEQLVVAGIATDHCVTTSVRWAKDLGVVKKRPGLLRGEDAAAAAGAEGKGDPQGEREGMKKGEAGKIVVLGDATACFNKGGFDAETVHKVHLASLEGEFARVMTTRDVLDQLLG